MASAPREYDDEEPEYESLDGDEPKRNDCLNCGYCSDCIQRSIDAADFDPDNRIECMDCDGTGLVDDPLYKRSCPYCKGNGYLTTTPAP